MQAVLESFACVLHVRNDRIESGLRGSASDWGGGHEQWAGCAIRSKGAYIFDAAEQDHAVAARSRP